jgi:predicted acylesterase/phospholipase RssA
MKRASSWLSRTVVFTTLAVGAAGCLRTSVLVQKFNEGAIETGGGDPQRDPKTLPGETAQRRIEQELIDGYFGQQQQGEAVPRVVGWFQRDSHATGWFSANVRRWLCGHGKKAHVDCDAPQAPVAEDNQAQTAQRDLSQRVEELAPFPPEAAAPVCVGDTRQPAPLAAFVDHVRYRVAVSRAVEAAAALVDEGQISLAQIDTAARSAFANSATYLARRKWRRGFEQHTAGLVVKGGASTGIFSAGAVWVALNVAHQCQRDGECSAWLAQHHVRPQFELMSGTSTGAMVVTAADVFYAAGCDEERQDRLELFEKWFVCSPARNLYCTVDGSVSDLLMGDQLSLLEFDGLRKLLLDAVSPATIDNGSEVLLNAVDLRTGRLQTFSDQEGLKTPAEVASAALASAALPLIVAPEDGLPGSPKSKGKFAYLDGGVRSELPIAAAVRRGAERLLIVSSGPSVMGEAAERKNGLDIAVRYIDVSTGGVLESEIDWAPRLAQGRRLAEFTECQAELKDSETTCPAGSCDSQKLCSGDWDKVCHAAHAAAPPADSPSVLEATRNAEDLLAPLWQATSIYRDDRRVPGLTGYLFRRADQRKLFLAGAEEARQRCFEIAKVLGLSFDDEERSLNQKLVGWCTPTLKPLDTLCGGEEADEGLRSCSEPLPPLSAPTKVCPGGRR